MPTSPSNTMLFDLEPISEPNEPCSDTSISSSDEKVSDTLGKCSSKASPPSKIPSSKQRRKKGDGTGYIYRRTITRKGKQYEEFYYRYRDESGKLRSKYIPQRLLNKVEGSESHKLPVADILSLLGGRGNK